MVEYYWCVDVEWVDFVVNVVMYVVVVDVDCMDFDLDVDGVDCLWQVDVVQCEFVCVFEYECF